MLVKVPQNSGNVSVYEVDPQWTEVSDIKRYGRLIATKFVRGGWLRYQDPQRSRITEGGVNQPPITRVLNEFGYNWQPCDTVEVDQFERLQLTMPN